MGRRDAEVRPKPNATRVAPLVALAVPPVLAVLALGATAAFESRGVRLFGDFEPANLAEAAAIGRAADVLRFLAADPDPTRVFEVRPFFISSGVTRVISSGVTQATAIEAAVWSRQPALVELLEGTLVSGAEGRRHVACLATDLGVADVARHLVPEGASCVPGAALAAITQRR